MVFIKALLTSVKDVTRAGGDVPVRGEMQFISQKALFSVGDYPPMKHSTLASVISGIMEFVYRTPRALAKEEGYVWDLETAYEDKRVDEGEDEYLESLI